MATLETTGLTKRFGGITALYDVSCAISAGEIVGFLGPNGAGKTTTVLMLLGLTEPTKGVVRVVGLDPTREPLAVKRVVGYLPDNVGFYPGLTGRENLRYTAKLNGIPRSEAEARIDELLHEVRLEDAADKRADQYSRGMRQRLGIAAALIHRPEVLFLDEPASALDPAGRKEVLDLIGNLRGRISVVMSTHILADVERVCDVVGIIAKGRMLVQSPREQLLEHYAIPAFEVEGADHAALALWVQDLRRPEKSR